MIITKADLQQLAQGLTPAYLQRFTKDELLQELANRLLEKEQKLDEMVEQLDRYEEEKEC